MSRASKARVRPGDRIEGLVTSAAAIGTERDPALVVFLRPWQDGRGALQKKELRVVIPTASLRSAIGGMTRWQGRSVALGVDRAVAAGANTLETAFASRLRAKAPTAAVAGRAKQERVPRRVSSKTLGLLVLDRDLGAYVGKRRTAALRYEVTLSISDPDDDATSSRELGSAERRVSEIERELPRIRECICDSLLEIYNQSWRGTRRALTRAGFARKLALQSLDLGARRTTLYFGAGGLFLDHVVEVRMSPRGGITEVLLAG